MNEHPLFLVRLASVSLLEYSRGANWLQSFALADALSWLTHRSYHSHIILAILQRQP